MFLLFDLDGVLVDFRDLHKTAFIQAWNTLYPDQPIDDAFHERELEARSTKQKIKILTDQFPSIPVSEQGLSSLKQSITHILLEKEPIYRRVQETLRWLKEKGIPFACCSNSIRSTIQTSLEKLVPLDHFAFLLSNEDVVQPKPSPEIYETAQQQTGRPSHEILVFEDSVVGKKAARDAGLQVIDIIDALDLTPRFIEYSIQHRRRPLLSNVNVVIPMAGLGSRFSTVGYDTPKPFLPVLGKPMYEVVLHNLIPPEVFSRAEIHLIVRNEHLSLFHNHPYSNLHLHGIPSLTEGPACTVLTLKEIINHDTPLMIANSDQYLEWNAMDFYYALSHPDWDGVISTFHQPNPKDRRWSYVKMNDQGEVTEVAEKTVISEWATTGIYGWKRGSDFVRDAEQMILQNERVNNEFYVCPVYHQTIHSPPSGRVRTLHCKKMWGLGVPEDYELFCKTFNVS
jgi:HAD superfamily hydrolase (TIGR01509 family)